MGYRLLICSCIFINSLLFGQISVKTNLPPEIKTGSEIAFEAKIWKGPIKNFSKYQLELPPGVTITEVDCKTGSFNQEENIVKIIWAITPSETEFTINLKLNAGTVKGNKTIVHKYYYLEKGEKREIEMAPININFVDSLTLQVAQNGKTGAENDQQQASIPNPEELRQQVWQLKKDSKEAMEVGEKEKSTAQKKLDAANEAITKSKAITNEKERAAALQKAMADKDKAESDLAVANRILTLAHSLEDNAAEIEKLNQSLDSVGTNDLKNNKLVGSEVGKTGNSTNNNEVVKPKVNTAAVEKAKQNALNKGAKDAKGLYKPIAVDPKNAREVIQQVAQIKRDSRQAREVGLREKKKAEASLTEAYEALKRAEYISDEEEKKLAIEKANRDKQKAEKDLETASKILSLAESLARNAQEIGGLSDAKLAETESVAASGETGGEPQKKEEARQDPIKDTVAVTSERKTSSAEDVEKLSTLFSENKAKAKDSQKETKEAESVTVFRVQVGAFAKTPDRSQFKSLGKVDVVKEGAMFKALYGNFKTREEAVIKRDEIRNKGFDPFIVIYKDGVKIK